MIEDIIEGGNRGHHHRWPYLDSGRVVCADGLVLAVLAGGGTYCTPRPAKCVTDVEHRGFHQAPWPVSCDYPGPYIELEVGFPTQRLEPWEEWRKYARPTQAPQEWRTVFRYVPVSLVVRLIADHGGEISELDEQDVS